MDASKQRRLARDGGDEGQARESYFRAMLQGGAGEFFQAVMNGIVRSSVFVLRAPKGAYYQSAGTSQEGMSEGASPFLIVRTAAQLQSEGVTCFDLGGAMDVNEGLCRFKAGFGAVAHEFEEAEFVVAPPLLRKLRTGASILRRNPAKAFSQLLNIQQTYAYAADPATVAKQSLNEEPTEMRLEKLSDERLLELCGPGTEFSRQGERLQELGYNEAYAFFLNEELVHVSWLVTSVHDRSSIAEDLQLKAGEAEITHCYTASQWRGRGIYPKAVRLLCGEAASMGIRRLYMVTSSQNTSSQRGILKAGLKPCGRTVRVRVPALLGERALSLSTPRLRS
jgi:RimJ/RimL family protein N-acetyltransferase